jgi:protein-L-isoaspartate(D-aspartate) O-methyltransferase
MIKPQLLLGVILLACQTTMGQRVDRFAPARNKMVEDYVVSADIKNPRVIAAMRATPRHEFISPRQRRLAYFDMAIPIGHGQTISPPYIVAFMTAQLDPQPNDRVLEIGTGSGYQAAVLSPLVKDVFTIEIVEPLGRQAAMTLQRLGYRNVHPKIGDGFKGWEENAPFNKIIVTCSPENIPQPLIDQLADGGQIIVPIGERFQQTLCRFVKVGDKLEREPLQATFFVPMTGEAEANRQVKEDSANPQVVEGSFESKSESDDSPSGWYYVRQGVVQEDAAAPDGQHVLALSNTIPGRSAHALQAFGVDGSLVRQIEVAVSARGQAVQAGPDRSNQAHLIVEFYGENRSPVGQTMIGPWRGTFDWRREERRITVPSRAKLAVVGVGLFGATGQLDVDHVVVSVAADRRRPRRRN